MIPALRAFYDLLDTYSSVHPVGGMIVSLLLLAGVWSCIYVGCRTVYHYFGDRS